MIIIYYFTNIVYRQMQIPDFIDPSNMQVKTIRRYRRVNFSKTIEVCFRKRKRGKRLIKCRIKKLKQLTLERWLNRSKIVQDYPVSSGYKQIKPEQSEIKSLGFSNDQESKQIQEGPYLYNYPYMHVDRFYSVPSVLQEEFCNSPLLRDEWKYYQEIEAFTGLFQHMIALNSFKYWDTV